MNIDEVSQETLLQLHVLHRYHCGLDSQGLRQLLPNLVQPNLELLLLKLDRFLLRSFELFESVLLFDLDLRCANLEFAKKLANLFEVANAGAQDRLDVVETTFVRV